nr:MAG TPA: minor structural protein [Caudoviricetes sp.]
MALKRSDLRKILENEDMTARDRESALLDLFHDEIDILKDAQDDLKDQLKTAQDDLKEAQKNGGGDDSEWKEKYESERDAFKKFKDEQTAKDSRAAKEAAYKKLLEEAKVSAKVRDNVIKVTNFEEIELDEKGQIKDAADVKKKIESDWSGFIEKSNTTGADVKNPPSNDGGTGSYTSREEARKGVKSTAEMMKRIRENPQLYSTTNSVNSGD